MRELTTCQWEGCVRPKRSGKGARYCKAHQRVADQREKQRKKKAAKLSRWHASKATKRDGLEYMQQELREYGEQVRATLEAFGLRKL